MSSAARLRSALVAFPWRPFALGLAICLALATAFPGGWISVLPAILAIVLAMGTKWVLSSLAAAVLLGGLLVHVPSAPATASSWGAGVTLAGSHVWTSVSDPFNILLLLFVAPMLMLIGLVAVGGGFEGVVRLFARFARGPRSTQLMTALAGIAICFDEYAHTMIIGPSMRPLSDKHRVSREKLAFIVDSFGAPLTALSVISTWVGYEIGLFAQTGEKLGLGKTGFEMLLDALSFRFYCMLMVVFVLLNVLTGRDFGPMARAELRARRTGKLMEDNAKLLTGGGMEGFEMGAEARPRALTAALPLSAVVVAILAGFWLDGGSPGSPLSAAAWQKAFVASQNGSQIFAIASAVGVALALLCARFAGGISARVIARTIGHSFVASLIPVGIMTLAWSLTATCNGLHTGEFLAAQLGKVVSPQLFPALLFLTGSAMSFATGTAWGTMAILIPIGLPLAHSLDGGVYGATTILALGAVLDGSIFGDHCSPISETAIMSSLSTGCDLTHHVRTQLPYALLVAILALTCGYLPAGFGFSPVIGIVSATAVILVVLYTLGINADGRRAGAAVVVSPTRTEIG